MSDVSGYLAQARSGAPAALDKLYEVVYPELKRLAAAQLRRLPPGGTLTPTVLVNEAYVSLHGGRAIDPVDRRHLMACFARAMRYILVDHVRAHYAAKRGAGRQPTPLTESIVQEAGEQADLLDIDRALETLGEVDTRLREIVELRFFGGLNETEIAELHGVSPRTVRRDWQRARAFLHAQLAQ